MAYITGLEQSDLGMPTIGRPNTASLFVKKDATGTGGTDDYASLASLLEIDFHYQIDALGSKSEYVKY